MKLEDRDIDNQIAIRNAIQAVYTRFRGSSPNEVEILKELSLYPLKIIGVQINKCANERIPEEKIVSELLRRIKAISYHAPTEHERNEFYDKYQSDSSKRCLELLGSGLSHDEMKPIIFSVLETMREDGVLRNDRPLPTDPNAQWQVHLVQGMNESDRDYIERIDLYKNENNVKLADHIPLTDLQTEWLRYINCESDERPMQILGEKKIGLTLISSETNIDPLSEIEF